MYIPNEPAFTLTPQFHSCTSVCFLSRGRSGQTHLFSQKYPTNTILISQCIPAKRLKHWKSLTIFLLDNKTFGASIGTTTVGFISRWLRHIQIQAAAAPQTKKHTMMKLKQYHYLLQLKIIWMSIGRSGEAWHPVHIMTLPALALKISAHNSTFKYRKFFLNQDKSVRRL